MVRKATRESYGETLVELGETNPDIIVLDADLSQATKTVLFQKKFPDRFIECGIAEANMLAVAAGLASTGKIVYASSFAMFSAGRAFEIIRNTVGLTHANVKIGATHAGISVGEDGATHQCCEDIALMRCIPGMTVLCPADACQTAQAVKAVSELDGPAYLRMGRMPVPMVYTDASPFEIGRANQLTQGIDVTVVATGLMVYEAIQAAKRMEKEGISVRVIDMHTIKPLDQEALLQAAEETGCIVTAEEHSILGGLGSAVSEVVSEQCPVPVLKVGVQDRFGYSGPGEELLCRFGLNAEFIVRYIRKGLELKTKNR